MLISRAALQSRRRGADSSSKHCQIDWGPGGQAVLACLQSGGAVWIKQLAGIYADIVLRCNLAVGALTVQASIVRLTGDQSDKLCWHVSKAVVRSGSNEASSGSGSDLQDSSRGASRLASLDAHWLSCAHGRSKAALPSNRRSSGGSGGPCPLARRCSVVAPSRCCEPFFHAH